MIEIVISAARFSCSEQNRNVTNIESENCHDTSENYWR